MVLLANTRDALTTHPHRWFKNHKMIEGMNSKLDFAKKAFVEKKEKTIKYGTGQKWKDIEGDEADLRKELADLSDLLSRVVLTPRGSLKRRETHRRTVHHMKSKGLLIFCGITQYLPS